MKKGTKRMLWLIVLLIASGLGYAAYRFHNVFFSPNINLTDNEKVIILIPTGSDFSDVCRILRNEAGLISEDRFIYAAKQKGYVQIIKPGRFEIVNHMTNNSLVNLLRSGNQLPVNLTFNNARTKSDIARKVANQLEFSADSLLQLLNSDSIANVYGFTAEEFSCMFIPNTYQVLWNTPPEKFIERMHREYEKFWHDERMQKADDLNLTPVEVSILASIVVSETARRDEMSRVAGVYINRLNKGMKLEADPTVKFAVGDFELKRILFRHLEYDSPYNTYKYQGLPPGPIYIPDAFAIDAVLNYEKHNYLFMCAKDDFSGYHAFAKTHTEHVRNAYKYHQALNRAGIR
jgi:UPF0755 protein